MIERTNSSTEAGALRPEGPVVLLLANGADRHWAADEAIRLSSRWAEEERRIVLADLHLENPLLHLGLDVPNLEGVVDIFLYGASLSRIAQPVRDDAFYLIPAGTYAPDVEEIYRNPRWRKLVAGFRDTGAVLALFAPAENADLDAVAGWAPEAIVLGGRDDELEDRLAAAGIRVLGVIESPEISPPAGEPPTPPAPAAAVAAASGAAAGPSPAFPVGGPSGPEPPADPAAVELHRLPESELELPPPPVRRRRERGIATLVLWILFLVILIGTAGYLVATIRPDLLQRFLGVDDAPVAAGVAAETVPAAPTRAGELLPYSVHVRAFPSFDAAREELAAETRRLAGVPFFISPEEIQGITYYKIFSGLATDTTRANRLRDRLVDIGAVDEEDAVGAWSLIQFTPLAFDLGEYPTADAAQLRADSLLQLEIPTYTAEIGYSDGSRRWQLYAGAYPDSASASLLRERLAAAGVEAPLAARTGVPATLPE